MIDIDSEKSTNKRFRIPAFLEPPPPPASEESPGGQHEEKPPEPEKDPLTSTAVSAAVIVCGVILPSIAIVSSNILNFEGIWHMVLKHPIETLIECGMVLYLPIANYISWSAICKKDSRHPIRLGLINGTAIGTSLVAFAVLSASLILGYPTLDRYGDAHPLMFSLLAAISWLALAAGVYQTEVLRRSKATRPARVRTTLYSLLGVLLSLVAIGGSEAQGTIVRLAEQIAASDNTEERMRALTFLRTLDPKKDLRMEIADPRSAGLPGLFVRFDDATARQLFFAITGEPYRNAETADATMQADDYLHTHVVGDAIPGLSLTRSQLSGSFKGQSLSSTLDWTFVFKNRTFAQQEARAEIALPPGAVVSGLTLWMNGEPRPAAFGATDKVQAAYNWIVVNHRDPALVTDLGKGRVLLQAYPVPAQGEMKVNISITAPLKLDSATEATTNLPRLVDSNFAVSGDNSLRLKSTENLEMSLGGLRRTKALSGEALLTGSLKGSDISGSDSGLPVTIRRPASFGTIATNDSRSPAGGYLVESIAEVPANIPDHLVVVVDGSQTVKDHADEITSALSKLPRNISTSIIVASGESQKHSDPLPLAKGLDTIRKEPFTGGHDNLQAVIDAAQEVGDTKNGAVLWIHGPQPGFNQEMYILTQFASTPTFYDLDVKNGGTNLSEVFKNHKEIGPFIPVSRSPSVQRDLERLIAKWQPNSKDYVVRFDHTYKAPSNIVSDPAQATAMSNLWANDQCAQLLAHNDTVQAADIAVRYGLVTPVSGATVLESKSDYRKFGLTENAAKATSAVAVTGSEVNQGQTPMIQGATNGVIGPQAGDATVVMGINTAGTVRVNNLANLEALLNIFANLGEILGLVIGAVHIISGLMGLTLKNVIPGVRAQLNPIGRVILGVGFAMIGLGIPGCINWLVGSARDSNLFS